MPNNSLIFLPNFSPCQIWASRCWADLAGRRLRRHSRERATLRHSRCLFSALPRPKWADCTAILLEHHLQPICCFLRRFLVSEIEAPEHLGRKDILAEAAARKSGGRPAQRGSATHGGSDAVLRAKYDTSSARIRSEADLAEVAEMPSPLARPNRNSAASPERPLLAIVDFLSGRSRQRAHTLRPRTWFLDAVLTKIFFTGRSMK